MRLFRSHLLFKIGLYATVIHLSTAPRNSGIPFVKSKCQGLSAQPYQVLFSTWALPPQPCAQSGKCRMYEARLPYWVLVGMWALPAQPYSRHEKMRCRSRAHRSTITRLPSGTSVSRSTSFRSGAFGVGAGTAHRCTRRVGGTSSHPRSA